jgi:hypothetical protein
LTQALIHSARRSQPSRAEIQHGPSQRQKQLDMRDHGSGLELSGSAVPVSQATSPTSEQGIAAPISAAHTAKLGGKSRSALSIACWSLGFVQAQSPGVRARCPPLCGSAVFHSDGCLVYTQDSVGFCHFYPGLYAPRTLDFQLDHAEAGVIGLLTQLFPSTKQSGGLRPLDASAALREAHGRRSSGRRSRNVFTCGMMNGATCTACPTSYPWPI